MDAMLTAAKTVYKVNNHNVLMFLLQLSTFILLKSFKFGVFDAFSLILQNKTTQSTCPHSQKLLNLIFRDVREGSSSLATQPVLQIASNQREAESPSDQSAAPGGGASQQQPIRRRPGSGQARSRGSGLFLAVRATDTSACQKKPTHRCAHAWPHYKHVVQKK